jgi:hypothetical protein
MTYDSELKCKACGSIGLNELDNVENWVYCECGEAIKYVGNENDN